MIEFFKMNKNTLENNQHLYNCVNSCKNSISSVFLACLWSSRVCPVRGVGKGCLVYTLVNVLIMMSLRICLKDKQTQPTPSSKASQSQWGPGGAS